MTRGRWFWAGFLIVTLLIAGGLSAVASSSPDGLDAATLRGCQVIESDGSEALTGQCIAQNARDHAMAASPLADYSVRGAEGSTGLAGVLGVLITLFVAGGLFLALARAKPRTTTTVSGGD
ncbi:MAG: PDGLE domain-containing protein [Mycobacterium sp.]|nr:PDGLE domain-containing protein [Mycobacterium sp.]